MEMEIFLHLFIATNCILLPCITSSPLMFLRDPSKAKYMTERQAFVEAEERMKIGENLTLSTKEKTVNNFLMTFKQKEINASRNGAPFPPSLHFFKGKALIEKSQVFQIISKLPKGKLNIYYILLHIYERRLYTSCFCLQIYTTLLHYSCI